MECLRCFQIQVGSQMMCRIKQGFPSGKSLLKSYISSVRVKKLRETLVAVQQLEKKMSSLRSWLAHIEMELSRPIVYDTCDEKEIEKKLNQQQVNGTAHTKQSADPRTYVHL